MRTIAYFINQYPKVSHSFIRREIQALERQGYEVARYAARNDPSELTDPRDIIELDKTTCLTFLPKFKILSSTLKLFTAAPLRFLSVLVAAVRIGWRSDRGLINHLFYFVEACVLNSILRGRGIAHIHAHFGTNSAAVAMFASQLGGITYSFTVHGPDEFDKPEFLSLGEKINHSQFVVAVSSFGSSQLYRWIDHSMWHKVKIVHCGLDEDFYSYSEIKPNVSMNLVCVGRLCEQKGQGILLQAVSDLVREGVNINLVLVGDGPMRSQLETLISTQGIESSVRITGWISSDDVRQEILDARIMVLPSFAEGLPVVIMEAMSMQRPVISTYIAGIPELVKDGENGWLIPAGSVGALKDAIISALDTDAEELDRLGKNARRAVLDQHDIERETAKLGLLFDQCLNPGQSSNN